ncbi:hypothetical protein IFM89_016007 [Coptis chinensis]|uniref:Uncharacterized protein n=1 Tax=Coptis chinensis TaxID=261450 RepID=A0A835M528_9MAGN|nr:hypothetical protein IFM89_016007 [Coptis chinensis]
MTNAAVVAMSKNYPDLVVFRLCIMGRHLPDHLTGEPMDMGFGAIVMNCKKLIRRQRRGSDLCMCFGDALNCVSLRLEIALLGASAVLGLLNPTCDRPFDYVKSQIQKDATKSRLESTLTAALWTVSLKLGKQEEP